MGIEQDPGSMASDKHAPAEKADTKAAPAAKVGPTLKQYRVEAGQNYKGLAAGTIVKLTEAEAAAAKDVLWELRPGEAGYQD